jgi:hypothetical protein
MNMRQRFPYLCALLVLFFAACSPSSREEWLHWSGLRRAPAPPALVLDVIVDASADAPGSPATLRDTINALAPTLFARGALLRVWGVGESAARSPCYITVPITPVEDASTASVEVRTRVLRALQPYFASPSPRRSPLVDVIATVALETSPPGDRVIVLVSDLAEMSSHGRFEVTVPEPDAFVATLQRDGVILPGSLTGMRVICAYSHLGPHTSSAHDLLALRAVFRAALLAAGAERVVFTTASPQPNNLRKE